MMVLVTVLWVVIFGSSAQALKLINQLPENITFSDKRHEKTQELYDQNPDIDNQKGHSILAKDLFQEFDRKAREIVEKAIYNETDDIQICWNNIIYLNESAGGKIITSNEVQVVFNFPANVDQVNEDRPPKEYKEYAVHIGGRVFKQNFEVFEKNSSYTLSKFENITCETGMFLTKTYYEWPEEDKRKIVLKLTNEHPAFETTDFGDILESSRQSSDDLGNDSNSIEFLAAEEPESEPVEKMANNMDIASNVDHPVDINTFSSTQPKDSVEFRSGNFSRVNENGPSDQTFELEPQTRNEIADTTSIEIDRLLSNNSCSPLLTKLLLGNGILPSLCYLKKDERVLLRGDFVISKKHFDKVNRTEVIEPIYTIHENMEIEPTFGSNEKLN